MTPESPTGDTNSPRRSIVVTGCAGGLGRALARRLRVDGWRVVGTDIVDGTDYVDEFVPGDISNDRTIAAAILAGTRVGKLAGWVNNAAVAIRAPLHVADNDAISRTLRVNLEAPIRATREAIDCFLSQGTEGVIVNIASIQSRAAFPGWPAYVAAKGGLEAFTRYVAVEYSGVGIRCVAVSPGTVATEMAAAAFDAGGFEPSNLHPNGRLVSPESVASTVAFLLSDVAADVTGAVWDVDGGAMARCYPADTWLDETGQPGQSSGAEQPADPTGTER